MRYTAQYYEYEESDYEITDLIVTDTRISMDWIEGGERAGLVASSTDGFIYHGTMGFPRPDPEGLAEFRVYRAKNDELLLFGRWWRTDGSNAGTWLIRCMPQAVRKSRAKKS